MNIIQFKQIMKESNITEDIYSKTIQFFNDIGEILHFPDDPMLFDTVIIGCSFHNK